MLVRSGLPGEFGWQLLPVWAPWDQGTSGQTCTPRGAGGDQAAEGAALPALALPRSDSSPGALHAYGSSCFLPETEHKCLLALDRPSCPGFPFWNLSR